MAGFVDFEITWSAANFGTVGINFRARKAENEQEWQAALAGLSCDTPDQPAGVFEKTEF